MLKPTASFKLSKQTKRTLALGKFKNEHDRATWRRAMIDAELSAQFQPKISKGRNNKE